VSTALGARIVARACPNSPRATLVELSAKIAVAEFRCAVERAGIPVTVRRSCTPTGASSRSGGTSCTSSCTSPRTPSAHPHTLSGNCRCFGTARGRSSRRRRSFRRTWLVRGCTSLHSPRLHPRRDQARGRSNPSRHRWCSCRRKGWRRRFPCLARSRVRHRWDSRSVRERDAGRGAHCGGLPCHSRRGC
jgi:hypothetical protein